MQPSASQIGHIRSCRAKVQTAEPGWSGQIIYGEEGERPGGRAEPLAPSMSSSKVPSCEPLS
jgi:hypothetical protein